MSNAGAPLEQSLVGAILSRRFRLNQELGRGGMGVVYAAAPLDGGPPVAIKMLYAGYLDDEQVRTRFIEEGRMGTRLVHRNILRMHDVLTAEDGSPYLVMDLLDGVPLSAYTRNGGRIAAAHAVPILQGILSGLAAAHEQGIVHRDLKPGNVFLARDDGGLFVVKILDFGIAKVMDVAGGMGNRTRTGMLLGTPAYMSPEQITNAKDVDARADLWSAGVLFYEMLTGRTAFPAPTEYARLSAVLQNEPEPLERIDPGLAPMASFVALALQKPRDRRFQTAGDMARALHQVGAGNEPAQSRMSYMPLSRLPDRPWMSVPTQALVEAKAVPAALAPPRTPVMAAQNDEVTQPDALAASPVFAGTSGGGTLASLQPVGAPSPGPPIQVVLANKPGEGLGGTLTSQVARRGVAIGWVVAMVVTALVAGLAIGFALGRAF